MRGSLVAALLLGVLMSTPARSDDPLVAKVNLREIRRSQLDRELPRQNGSVKKALATLAERALLLQEAERSGFGAGLPTEPRARADAFLARIASSEVICGNITQNELQQMYSQMKPRFMHGDLYRIAELRWPCPKNGAPEAAECQDRATSYADERWRPLVDAVKEPEDLAWIGRLRMGDGPIRYVEYTFHVDEHGRSSVPADLVAAIQQQSVGSARIASSRGGARLQLLIEHRAPIHRRLEDSDVRAEVMAELCPRLVTANRATYVSRLLQSAHIQLFEANFPPGHDVGTPEKSPAPR